MPKDEANVLALCDQALGAVGLLQHRFDFQKGDPGKRAACRRLPVDAFYPDHRLVIEYRERQHSEPVAIMDRRMTVSGCPRGEQRSDTMSGDGPCYVSKVFILLSWTTACSATTSRSAS